ncbi:LOW QUALITY PROTEIN: uncharacterized protein [Chamaea fasciata]|uniref:LOW QUALITY PROTEIN: uncharacterized protein n=1 Tax=Chamaea fasciata TaxID=190680 RepID=UPI00336A3411
MGTGGCMLGGRFLPARRRPKPRGHPCRDCPGWRLRAGRAGADRSPRRRRGHGLSSPAVPRAGKARSDRANWGRERADPRGGARGRGSPEEGAAPRTEGPREGRPRLRPQQAVWGRRAEAAEEHGGSPQNGVGMRDAKKVSPQGGVQGCARDLCSVAGAARGRGACRGRPPARREPRRAASPAASARRGFQRVGGGGYWCSQSKGE